MQEQLPKWAATVPAFAAALMGMRRSAGCWSINRAQIVSTVPCAEHTNSVPCVPFNPRCIHAQGEPVLCVLLAHCREMERREKVEEARRETERILAAQEAEVAARKVRALLLASGGVGSCGVLGALECAWRCSCSRTPWSCTAVCRVQSVRRAVG